MKHNPIPALKGILPASLQVKCALRLQRSAIHRTPLGKNWNSMQKKLLLIYEINEGGTEDE